MNNRYFSKNGSILSYGHSPGHRKPRTEGLPVNASPWTMLLGYLLFGFAPMLAKLAMQRGWDGPHAVLIRFGLAGVPFSGLVVRIGFKIDKAKLTH